MKVEPDIADGTKTPDFLIGQRNRRFYLEATTVGDEYGPFTLSPNERDVVQKLNTIDPEHFGILVDIKGSLPKTLGRCKVVQPFERLLASHQPEAVRHLIETRGRSAAPAATVESDDWILKGWLIPNDPKRQRSHGTKAFVRGFWRAMYTDSIRLVHNAVRKKAKKYPELDAPFVVAVHTRDPCYNGRQHDLEVLFGREQLHYSAVSPDAPAKFGRSADGVWSRGKAKRVHGFLRAQRVNIYNLRNASACLYVNPQSQVMLPDATLRLPRGTVLNDEMSWIEGENIADLMA